MDTAKKEDLLNKKAEQYKTMDTAKKQDLLNEKEEQNIWRDALPSCTGTREHSYMFVCSSYDSIGLFIRLAGHRTLPALPCRSSPVPLQVQFCPG